MSTLKIGPKDSDWSLRDGSESFGERELDLVEYPESSGSGRKLLVPLQS